MSISKELFADSVCLFFLALLKKKNLSKKEFCERVGINKSTLFHWTLKKSRLPSSYNIFVVDREFRVNSIKEIRTIAESKQ